MNSSATNLSAKTSNASSPLPKLKKLHFARKIADFLSRVTPQRSPQSSFSAPSKIGVLLQWGMGDAVLSLPLLRGLREAYPHASVTLIGKPWLSDLFSHENLADNFRTLIPPWTKYTGKYRMLERDWRDFFHDANHIRRERYDLLITPRFDVRDNLQLRLLKARDTAGFADAGGAKWLTQDFALSLKGHNSLHRTEVSAEVLRVLTGLSRPPTPRFNVPNEFKQLAKKRLREAGYTGGPILAVHGGAGHPIRRWGPGRFSAVLAQAVPKDVFVVIIADDTSPTGYDIRVPNHLSHMLWTGSLADLKAMLSLCDIILCGDSGVMHVAAACGCRVIGLFGPTWEGWFGPAGNGHMPIKVEPMPCRPCFDACCYASPLCMDMIPLELVTSVVQEAVAHCTAARAHDGERSE